MYLVLSIGSLTTCTWYVVLLSTTCCTAVAVLCSAVLLCFLLCGEGIERNSSVVVRINILRIILHEYGVTAVTWYLLATNCPDDCQTAGPKTKYNCRFRRLGAGVQTVV